MSMNSEPEITYYSACVEIFKPLIVEVALLETNFKQHFIGIYQDKANASKSPKNSN